EDAGHRARLDGEVQPVEHCAASAFDAQVPARDRRGEWTSHEPSMRTYPGLRTPVGNSVSRAAWCDAQRRAGFGAKWGILATAILARCPPKRGSRPQMNVPRGGRPFRNSSVWRV